MSGSLRIAPDKLRRSPYGSNETLSVLVDDGRDSARRVSVEGSPYATVSELDE